jgi:tetratricopeptide (TPR) repeat protein
LLNQKIILEIVPWIDNKLARGWNLDNKKNVVQQLKKFDLDINPINKDLWTLSILNKIQKDFTFSEFNLLEINEKTKISNDFGTQVLKEISPNDPLFKTFRFDANQYFKQNNFEQAIALIENGILAKNQSNANDYNQLGYYYLFTKQFQKALQVLQQGELIDSANLAIKLNMAHTYLLLDDFGKAKTIYKKFQNQNINTTTSWTNKLKQDIDDLKTAGITNPNFDRILNKLD